MEYNVVVELASGFVVRHRQVAVSVEPGRAGGPERVRLRTKEAVVEDDVVVER